LLADRDAVPARRVDHVRCTTFAELKETLLAVVKSRARKKAVKDLLPGTHGQGGSTRGA
jgi:hypothetical protein